MKIENFRHTPLHRPFFYLLVLFLPTQLGLHFWPSWSFVGGLAIDYLSPTIYLTDILIILTLFFWFLSSIFHRPPLSSIFHPLSSKFIIPTIIFTFYLLPFTFFILLSFFYLNPFAHLFKLGKLLEFYFLFIYIKNNVTMKQFNNLTILLIIGLLFESFLAIFQFVNQHSLGGVFYLFGERAFTSATPGIAQAIIDGKLILRPYGTFSHPNSLAGYFLASLFLVLSLRGATCLPARQERRSLPRTAWCWSNLLNKFIILNSYLVILVLFLSFSRSVWFVAFLIFFSIGLLNIKKLFNILKQKYILPVVLVILVVPVILFSRPFASRLSSITTTDTQSLEKRLNLNFIAWKMFLSSPLIGVGLNNFIPNLPGFTQNQPQVRFYQPVHNIYLLILAESGLLGLSLFLYILYKSLKILLSSIIHHQYPPSIIYLLLSLIIILLLGLFDHYWLTLQQNQLLLVLVVGIIFGLNKEIFRLKFRNNHLTM